MAHNNIQQICEDVIINNNELDFIQKSLYYEMGQRIKTKRTILSKPSLNNEWYPVGCSSQLPKKEKNKILSIQLFCEPIIIYRSSNGKVVAAQDRCPHRSSPLSMGIPVKTGGVQCPYHNWSFDNHGKCNHIPSASQTFISKVSLFTIPCHEYNDIIWVFKANNSNDYQLANIDDIINNFSIPIHNDPKYKYMECISDVSGNWLSQIFHAVDYAHVYFIHGKQRPFKSRSYSSEQPFNCNKFMDKRGYLLITKTSNRCTIQRFDPPCIVTSYSVKHDMLNVFYLIPINKNHTRQIFRSYSPLWKKLNKFVPAFKYSFSVQTWNVLKDDNHLIDGMSFRVDSLNAPIYHYRRSEDDYFDLVYDWTNAAIRSDKYKIWFNSWNANKRNCFLKCNNNNNTDDIEDILSQQKLIKTSPNGEIFSSTGMKLQYPPLNESLYNKYKRKK
eukprot:532299_1